MKSTTLLASLASLLTLGISSISAECYSDGVSWPNREEARNFVQDACYGNGGMFTGQFAPRQMKSMRPRSGSIGLVFDVQNQNTEEGFDLGDDDW